MEALTKTAAETVASDIRAQGAGALVAMGDIGDKAAVERVVNAGLNILVQLMFW